MFRPCVHLSARWTQGSTTPSFWAGIPALARGQRPVLLNDSVLVRATDDHSRRLITSQSRPLGQEACLLCILGPDTRLHQELLVLCVRSQPAPLESSRQPLSSNGPKSWRSEPRLTKAAALGGVTMEMRSDEKPFLSAGDTQMHMAAWGSGDGV